MSILLRALVLTALAFATAIIVGRIGSGEMVGANIGAGLLAFLVLSLGSLAWALVNARNSANPPAYGPVILSWALTGALTGILFVLVNAFIGSRLNGSNPSIDWSVAGHDALFMVPFAVVLIAVPALLGTAIGAAMRSGR